MNAFDQIRVTNKLLQYEGTNDYILLLKSKIKSKKLSILTINQAQYIEEYYDKKPIVVNKIAKLHPSVTSFIKTVNNLPDEPKSLYIKKVLGRTDDSIDVWASFDCQPNIYKYIRLKNSYFIKDKGVKKEDIDFSILKRKPMPHQEEAIVSLLSKDRFILADDMGLGKTTSAIAAAVLGKYQKILVVCPASLKKNWVVEISNFEDLNDITILNHHRYLTKKWNIVNYDTLKNYHTVGARKKNEKQELSLFEKTGFDLIIFDEAHYVKNMKSDRSKISIDLAKKCKTVWFLTGTPITNKPIDLFSLLEGCNSPLSGNWQRYVLRYCDGKSFRKGNKKVWITNGASNIDELRRYVDDIFLKRNKNEVLDLPDKIVTQRYYELEEVSAYNAYVKEYQEWYDDEIKKGNNPSQITSINQLSKLRKLIADEKVKYTIEQIEELLEDGHNVVVFSCFTDSIRDIYEHFNTNAVLIDGSVSVTKRQQIVDDFQNNPKKRVFCGNIIAAGVGLTLTKADYVIFNDVDWVPANHSQAEDRIYRIGQDKKCTVIYNILADTIDSDIYNKLIYKFSNINQFMKDDFIYYDNTELIKDILSKITKK